MERKRVILLGATGSIGRNSIDIIRSYPDRFELVGLSAHGRVDELLALGEQFTGAKLALSGRADPPPSSRITWSGDEAIYRMLNETEADMVINGISGSAGLMPSVWSLESGKDLALANKETIVMAGGLIKELARIKERKILPVDSEHSAIFQLLRRINTGELARIVLTASGGAFRETPLEKFPSLSLEDALSHPTWDMGAKITIDSASMANKGLEVIEAYHLFDLQPKRIKVLIHPQSSIHSMVKTIDGSFYAQISSPDMRIPIQNALTYPDTLPSPYGELDFSSTVFSFSEPERDRYPLLFLAYQALEQGASYPLAYNAANEAAVEAFRTRKIRFVDLAPVVEETLQDDWSQTPASFSQTFELHRRVWDRAWRGCDKRTEK